MVVHLTTLDADQPAEAVAELVGLDVRAFEAALRAAHAEGWATPKEHGGIRFGRLAKDLDGFSIDIVEMSTGAPAPHTHPRGEFDLCFALAGTPTFDGHAAPSGGGGPEGGGGVWLVYPPRSRHVPTVQGGSMLIVYFLPHGEITFEASPR